MQDDARRYDVHLSLANDVMFSYDPQLRIISISGNVERVLGYRRRS
jgi:PAS domain-containing protein